MERNLVRLTALTVVALVLALCGCDGSGTTGPSPADVQQDVAAAALAAATAGPESEAARSSVVDLMSLISTVAPATSGAVSPAVAPSCPSNFELPSGLAGTCSVSDSGVVTFAFEGTVSTASGQVSVSGSLVASKTAQQPASGSTWSIDYSATATGPLGTATWSLTGTVTLNANDEVVDFALTMTHTMQPSGGATSTVTIVLSPTSFELVATGPRGNTVRITLDASTMTGSVSINGREVASIAISDGCVTIDFTDPALADEVRCPAA